MVSNQNKTPRKKGRRVVRKKSNHGCIMVVKLDNTMTSTADSRARQQMQEVRKELKDRTHFHDFEVERLLHIYWKITQNARMNIVEFQFFLLHVFGMTNLYMIRLMYNFLKEKKLTGKAQIGAETFVNMLSIFCRGTLQEKINFAFKVYDQGVGFLSDETVMNYLRRTFHNKGIQDGLIEYEPREYFSYVLQIFDPNDEKKITFNRFKEAVMAQPPLLQALGQIFPDRLAIYAFLTTFTHLVTTDHVKYIAQKETETVVMPMVQEKNVVKMQMVPFTQEHVDEIFNEILEEIPVRDEEKESEEEDQEGEEIKETNVLDDEDIDEYIYDEEESDEEELMEDDEEESDKVEDEEEIIIEEEEEEEEESEEEAEALFADEEKGADTEEIQGESKEESMELDEEESSTSEEEYEDAAETIDLGRDDILLQVSSSFECEDVEEESTEESEESETETVSTEEEEESSSEEEESVISSETELKGLEGEEEMLRGEEFYEGEAMEAVEGEEAEEGEITEPETIVEEYKKSEEASDKKSEEADKVKEVEDESKADEGKADDDEKSLAVEESEVDEE